MDPEKTISPYMLSGILKLGKVLPLCTYYIYKVYLNNI